MRAMAEPLFEDEEAILRAVHAWTRDRPLALVRRPLDTGLDTLDPKTQRPLVPSASLRGIAVGGPPAPSDAEIERWREEKYALWQG
jgi:hypothetical protein